jgi:chromosome segregation ATPase
VAKLEREMEKLKYDLWYASDHDARNDIHWDIQELRCELEEKENDVYGRRVCSRVVKELETKIEWLEDEANDCAQTTETLADIALQIQELRDRIDIERKLPSLSEDICRLEKEKASVPATDPDRITYIDLQIRELDDDINLKLTKKFALIEADSNRFHKDIDMFEYCLD